MSREGTICYPYPPPKVEMTGTLGGEKGGEGERERKGEV